MSNEDLSPDQQHLIAEFAEISQISDMNRCRQFLAQNHWNLELAVQHFVSGGDVTEPQPSPNQRNFPVQSTSNRSVTDVLLMPLRWLFQSHPESLNPEQDTRKFLLDLSTSYGNDGPQFCETSYNQSVATAYRQSKLLMIYLHSPMHDDTPKFCRQVLYRDNVVRSINSNMIVWGGSIWDAEAYNLSLQLKVSTFPFVAFLICQNERTVQIADRIQGFVDEATLLERMNSTLQVANGIITRSRRESESRNEAALLRAQQDREYHESVEADRLAREKSRQEQEQKERQEEEEAQQKELQAAIELSQKLEYESILSKKRMIVDNSTVPDNATDAALIRFQLPQGSKISRKFYKHDKIQIVYDYLMVYFADNGIKSKNFMVSTNFPKQDLTDMDKTVEEMGLFPRGALFVTDLDA